MNEIIYPITNCTHCDKPIPTHPKCSIVQCILCAKCEKCETRLCRSCDNKTSILKWVEVDGKDIYLCAKCY